jgi:hypothetical protein
MIADANAHSFAWADIDEKGGVSDGPEPTRPPLRSQAPVRITTSECCQSNGCPEHPSDEDQWTDCDCLWWFRPCPCYICLAEAAEAAGWSPAVIAFATARRPTPEMRLRGIETHNGEPSWCLGCERHVPEGPDTCLGLLPLVSYACCGHGLPDAAERMAYVAFDDSDDRESLYGRDALDWFAARGVGAPSREPAARDAA